MPTVHDLRSVQRDRPLYDDLYRRTAQVAEPAIGEALEKVTAGEASQLLARQLEGLRSFVLDLPGEVRASDPDLIAALESFAGAELRRDDDVLNLRHSLSEEFAVGFWDWMLQRMRVHAPEPGKRVARADLRVPGQGEEDPDKWAELDKLLVPFGLDRADAAMILERVLTQLLETDNDEVVRLPLGLSIDKAMLRRVLANQAEPASVDEGLIDFLFGFLRKESRPR